MSIVQPSGGGRSGLRSTSITRKRQAALSVTRSAANVSASEYSRAILVATQP